MKLQTLGCWGGYPYQDQGTTSFLLTGEDGFTLLIDCGSRALNELEKVMSPLDLDAVIISHYHPDHVADLGVLRHYRQLYPKDQWTPRALPIYGHTEDAHEFAKLTIPDVSEGIAYGPNQAFTIGSFTINVMKTVHPVPCYAMKIAEQATGQVLVFTGDTGYFDGLADFANGADLFLADVYFYEGKENHPAHLTSKEAGLIAKEANVKKLVLTHLPQFPEPHISPDNHLETLRQQAQHWAEGIPVKLAQPHKVWDLGDLT